MTDSTYLAEKMNTKQRHVLIREMFPLIARRAGWKAAEYVVCGQRTYRGKRRFVAGYSHSRIGAHHFSGLVYDRILGWGETQQAAIDMMRSKLSGEKE